MKEAKRAARAAPSFQGAPWRAQRRRKMKRTTLFLTIFVLALVAVRGVAAAPQHQGSATLTGVVLGPDDKPVPHAAVTYQSSGGNAPHAVHADAHGRF